MELQNVNQTRRPLKGEELSALAARMALTTDPIEADLLWEAIVRGFYGIAFISLRHLSP
jgi:hypothetical protein